MKKLLLIGDTSAREALGSKILHCSSNMEWMKSWVINVSYHSPSVFYSKSMQSNIGKIFYRLADRRSWEWWDYQREILRKIKEFRPNLVLVTGILPLDEKIFASIKDLNGKIVNYLTDDPWNPIHKRRSFLKNLSRYDHIFSTKKQLCRRLEAHGVISTSWLPFAYDPEIHYCPARVRETTDILFVGTGAKERLPWLLSLNNIPGIKKKVNGNNWENIKVPGWSKGKALSGAEYSEAISSACIVLGLLRAANKDQSTDRSYEIGAIGGCGLYQDTEEHRELLEGYPDAGFFKNEIELAEKAQVILGNPKLREEMRRLGSRAVRKYSNSYSARLQTILEWFEK